MPLTNFLNITSFALLGFFIIYFFGPIMSYKLKVNKAPAIIVSGVLIALIIVINFLVKDVSLAYDYSSILNISLYFIAYFFYKPQRKTTFFFASLAIISIFDYIQYMIEAYLDNSDRSIFVNSIAYCVIYLLGIIMLVIAKRAINLRVPEGYLDSLPRLVYIALFLIEISSFYSGEYSKDSVNNFKIISLSLNIISTGLVIFSIVYMVYSYTKLSIKQKEAELQIEADLKHYEDLISKNEDIRRFRHDYKNNLISLDHFIRDGKNEEALEYICDLNGILASSTAKYVTGNYLADAIITDKSNKAHESGTIIEFIGSLPNKGIKNSDLCTILSNSLDNAIRACEEIENAIIKIESSINPRGVVIEITNPIKERVNIKNNKLTTTKSDKKNHGFGVSNIKRTAEKYQGYVDLKTNEEYFTIEIGLVL